MNFFIPYTKDEIERDDVYNSIVEYTKQSTEWDIDI